MSFKKDQLFYRGIPQDHPDGDYVISDPKRAARYLVKGGKGTYTEGNTRVIVDGDLGTNKGKLQVFTQDQVEKLSLSRVKIGTGFIKLKKVK